MATHKLLTNKEGGYFYRFYPKIKNHICDDNKNTIQSDLFNPVSVQNNFSVVRSIYGKFIDKYNDKGLIIELRAEAEYLITDSFTNEQEHRKLQSKILIQVETEIFNYPFIKGDLYSLTVNEVIPL